jgi:hypothetical protein
MSYISFKVRFEDGERRVVDAPSDIGTTEVIDEVVLAKNLNGNGSWRLSRAGGQILDNQKTLDENGVFEGEELALEPAEQKVPPVEDWLRCPSCGHQNRADEAFCHECGKPLIFLSLDVYCGKGPLQKLDFSELARVRDVLTAVLGPDVQESEWKIYDKDLGVFLSQHRSLAENGVRSGHVLHVEAAKDHIDWKRTLKVATIVAAVLGLGVGGTIVIRRPLHRSVEVSPATASLISSQNQQFRATIGGKADSVKWSRSPQVGEINADGVYTAPASIVGTTEVTVTATSVADSSRSASSKVTLKGPSTTENEKANPVVRSDVSTLNGGETAHLTAAQGDGTSIQVSWSLDPNVGTISSDGTYTAPIPVPEATSVTVTATSASDSSLKGSTAMSLVPVAVSISPRSVTVSASSSVRFRAALKGTVNHAVRWEVSGGGSITNDGLYSAPEIMVPKQSATVTVISSADPTKRARAAVKLAPVVTLTLTPTKATLGPGQSQVFNVQLRGAPASSLRWSVDGPGTISESGLYQPPGTLAQEQTVHVRVFSENDPTKSASAVILLRPLVVMMKPQSAEMRARESVEFTAIVLYGSSTAVRWTLAGKGTLTQQGRYTAPSVVMADSTVHVTATSVADPSRSATVGINLKRFAGNGSFAWTGPLNKNETVTIDDAGPSKGSIKGEFLPGVPVSVVLSNKEYSVVQPPAPSNNWRRITLRSKRGKAIGVTIQWTVVGGGE